MINLFREGCSGDVWVILRRRWLCSLEFRREGLEIWGIDGVGWEWKFWRGGRGS